MKPKTVAAGLLLLLASVGPAAAIEQGLSIKTWLDVYREGEPSPQAWFRETYTFQATPTPWLFFDLVPIVERDSHGEILRDDLYDDTDRGLTRSASRFRAASAGFRLGATTLVLGKQRLTWGRTTFLNATDNLAPRDWTDPLDEVRLAPWAANLAWEKDRWHVDAALVPRYAPSRLPQLNGRWFTLQPETVANPATPAGPPELRIDYRWGNATFPSVTWDNLQGAARVGYRGSRGEVAAAYFRGVDDAPAIAARPGTPDLIAGTIPVFLDRKFLRLDVAGLDGELLFGPWIVRGEAGYFHYPDHQIDGYLLTEAEAEWSREGWQVTFAYGDAIGGNVAADVPAALDQALVPSAFLRVSKGDATEWQVGLDAAVGTKHGDSLVRFSGSYPFAGHVRVGGEVDLMGGEVGTFWGRWRGNDRVRVFSEFSF